MAKKMKRFEEGGYAGDDPIVKYRMGITNKPKDEYKDNAPYKSDDQGVSPAPLRQSALFTKMGKNEAIKDDVRSRALKFLMGSKDYKKGGKVSSASKRADGCATKGKTKGRLV
jgi:hypothetical protein